MNKPDFIIAGVTKCGTTALWYNLDKHPDITMASKDGNAIEMHYFDRPGSYKNYNTYLERFTGNKLNGEKTPGYVDKKRTMQRIKQKLPDVKLIVCVRNPTERAYSSYLMKKRSKNKNIRYAFTYKKCMNMFAGKGKYINRIENNILSLFDRKKLYVCVMERLKTNTKEEMKKIFDFLGVHDLNYEAKEIHPILREHRTRQEDVALSRTEKFYRVWTRVKTASEMPARKEINEYYKPFNQRLYDFLGYKIEEWEK